MISSIRFDHKLIQSVPYYSTFPQLLPLIGEQFGQHGKRLLLIGESHYLPTLDETGREITIHHDDETWYGANESLLDATQKKWLNTRANAGSGHCQQYWSKAYTIYRNIEYAILESGFQPADRTNMFQYVAYANYFLRPARTGVSLNVTGRDSQVSYETLQHLVRILHLEYLYFTSQLAWQSFQYIHGDTDHLDGARMRVFPHPGSAWWNRRSKAYPDRSGAPQTGKEVFISSLKEDQIFP